MERNCLLVADCIIGYTTDIHILVFFLLICYNM